MKLTIYRMSQHQYSTPIIIQNEKAIPLHRIEFDEQFRDEDWLQELLFEHPELIPFEEIDPLFRGSVGVAREVESGVGPIDILYVNSDGLLTLVETKLWRNPESRREAVAQIINYAAELAETGYEQLAQAVDETTESSKGLLIQQARQSAGFDEKRFHDGLAQNLKHGRFLLLIVGDGIREDVDAMAEFLSRQPNLGFTLRLIEIAMYRLQEGKDDPILVQPHIVARTREITRAIVEVRGDRVIVETPPEPQESGVRRPIAEDEFYRQLSEEVTPATVNFVKWMVDHANEHQLTVQWMQAGPVFKHYVVGAPSLFFTLFQSSKNGDLAELFRFSDRCKEEALPDKIWTDYFDSIVRLIPGASRRHRRAKSGHEWDDVIYNDSAEPLESIAGKKIEWLAAVDLAVKRVQEAMAKKPK
jgi:hypothetical protein